MIDLRNFYRFKEFEKFIERNLDFSLPITIFEQLSKHANIDSELEKCDVSRLFSLNSFMAQGRVYFLGLKYMILPKMSVPPAWHQYVTYIRLYTFRG